MPGNSGAEIDNCRTAFGARTRPDTAAVPPGAGAGTDALTNLKETSLMGASLHAVSCPGARFEDPM